MLGLSLWLWLAGNVVSVVAGLCAAALKPSGTAWEVVAVDAIFTTITASAACLLMGPLSTGRARRWAWSILLVLAAWNGIHGVRLIPLVFDDMVPGTAGPLMLNILTVALGVTLLRKSVQDFVFYPRQHESEMPRYAATSERITP